MARAPFRRPAMLSPQATEQLSGGEDPATRNELAHTSAAAVLTQGRAPAADPDLQQRLLRLAQTEGLDLLAGLWAASPAETLPGALWRLYLIHEWTHRDAHVIAERYRLGSYHLDVAEVVAGVATPPGPQEVRELADSVLRGVFTGEFDIALDRASAFLHIIATGSALDADWVEEADAQAASELTQRADALRTTAYELHDAAALWRAGKLD